MLFSKTSSLLSGVVAVCNVVREQGRLTIEHSNSAVSGVTFGNRSLSAGCQSIQVPRKIINSLRIEEKD